MGLQGFRDQKNSGIIVAVFVVIIFVFIFMFGLPTTDLFGGRSTKQIAKIGSHEIDTELMRSMILRHYDDRIFQSPELPLVQRQVVDNLAILYLLADEARNAGLRVSEDEWQNYLTNWESGNEDILQLGFLKKNKFSKQQYEYGLQRVQMSSRQYREFKENEILAKNYIDLMRNSLSVSDETLWTQYADNSASANVNIVRLSPDSIRKVLKATTDDEVAAYLASNLADVQAYYDAHRGDYTTPEKVKLQQVIIQKDFSKLKNIGAKTTKTLMHAERFAVAKRQLIDENLDFNQGFADYDESETKVDMGVGTLMPVEEKAEAIQKALEGKKVGDTFTAELDQYYVIAKVIERTDEVVTPIDDVKTDIAKKLIDDAKIATKTSEASAAIIAAIKGGQSLDDAINASLYANVAAQAPSIVEAMAAADVAAPVDPAAPADPAVTAPVQAALDVIVVPETERIKSINISSLNLSANNIEERGLSVDIVRDIRNAQSNTLLETPYKLADDTLIIQVVNKIDPDRAAFEAQKAQIKADYLYSKEFQLIGIPAMIPVPWDLKIYYAGMREYPIDYIDSQIPKFPGLWLQQKLAKAKLDGTVKVNEDYFNAEAARRAKREAQQANN